MSTCMKRRLLYASSQAYQPRMEVHARSVGWIEPPIVVRREGLIGHRTIDLALVGRVAEGVVIAFRGTLPPFFAGDNDGWSVLLDWLNDTMSLCIETADYPGGVHMGFAEIGAAAVAGWRGQRGREGRGAGDAGARARRRTIAAAFVHHRAQQGRGAGQPHRIPRRLHARMGRNRD